MAAERARRDLVVSVVSRVRNAESYVEDYIREVANLLEKHFKDYEIVLVDNASSDHTIERIEALQRQLRNIQLYCLVQEIADDAATVAGLEHAIGDCVVTLDAAHDPVARVIDAIALATDGVEIVYGVRKDRDRTHGRAYRFAVRAFFRFYGWVTKTEFPLESSSLRLLSRRSLNAFLDNENRYDLFTVVSSFAGFSFAELPYERSSRVPEAAVDYRKALGRAFRILFLSSVQPWRIVSALCLGAAFLNVLYGVYVFAVNLVKANVAEGWTTLSLQISGMFFLLFLMLALLSEYVIRLFMQSQRQPRYLMLRESSSLVLQRKQELNVATTAEAAADRHETLATRD